jgi:hypothetical protein
MPTLCKLHAPHPRPTNKEWFLKKTILGHGLKITTKIESLNDLQDRWKHSGGKKNDVAKFCGCYMVVMAMNEYESSHNDTLQWSFVS